MGGNVWMCVGCDGEGRDVNGNGWMCVGVWWGREGCEWERLDVCRGVVGKGGM